MYRIPMSLVWISALLLAACTKPGGADTPAGGEEEGELGAKGDPGDKGDPGEGRPR